MAETLLIDDFSRADLVSALGTPWRAITDRVMGGISTVSAGLEERLGRRCLQMRGQVRLENNGGFVQVALDLAESGATLDASGYGGIYLWVLGNDEDYSLHLRTPDVQRPWQSYRASFHAGGAWREVRLPFDNFQPYRLSAPLDTHRLRRVGVVGIGRAFTADLAIAEIGLY
jgi:hypothetical protein